MPRRRRTGRRKSLCVDKVGGDRLTCGTHLDANFTFEKSVGSSHRIVKSSIFTKG
jgi:hypothetical protein